MTVLSVNLNKVALLRNARDIGIPSVIEAAEIAIQAGAGGITVHPRPDQRHIRPSDVYELAEMLTVEFNIEGNPFSEKEENYPGFIQLVRQVIKNRLKEPLKQEQIGSNYTQKVMPGPMKAEMSRLCSIGISSRLNWPRNEDLALTPVMTLTLKTWPNSALSPVYSKFQLDTPLPRSL